jgi:hypothetical protein
MIMSRFWSINSYNITSLAISDQLLSEQTRYASEAALVSVGDGNGRATNKRRHGFAIRRAQRFARLTRALSVAIPVFAYICRYSFEISTKANRARSVGVHRERTQIRRRL